MAIFYQGKTKPLAKTKAQEMSCYELDLYGDGVCKFENTIIFVPGLLPSERAKVQYTINNKTNTARGKITKMISSCANRVDVDCQYFGSCGGCSLLHMPAKVALDAKIKGIAKLLNKSCQLELESPNSVISNDSIKGYRRVCRLAVRFENKKLIVGFRKRLSQDVISIKSCKILTQALNDLLSKIESLVNRLEGKKSIGHIELLQTDCKIAMLFRVVNKFNENDLTIISEFAKDNDLVVYQNYNYTHPIDNSVSIIESLIYGDKSDLFLQINNLKIFCTPSSFVQINKKLNLAMIDEVLKYINPTDTVLDLYCGLGNFTLPISTKAKKVVGVDIVQSMINLALENAKFNDIDNVEFFCANLNIPKDNHLWMKQKYDVLILDPGREGALEVCKNIKKLKPQKIIFISCNIHAVCKDIMEILKANYILELYNIYDMFAGSSHIEIMFVFTKK